MLPTTIGGIGMQLYASVSIEQSRRTFTIWLIPQSVNDDDTSTTAGNATAGSTTGDMRSEIPRESSSSICMLCAPKLAPRNPQHVPWKLIAARVDGFLRICSERAGEQHIMFADRLARELLHVSSEQVDDGVDLNQFLGDSDKLRLRTFFDTAQQASTTVSLSIQLNGRMVTFHASAIAITPRRIFAVWLVEASGSSVDHPRMAKLATLNECFDETANNALDEAAVDDQVVAGDVTGADSEDPFASCNRVETVVVELPLSMFFCAGSQVVLDPQVCVIVSCGGQLRKCGILPGDFITHVNGEFVGGSNELRNTMCRIFDRSHEMQETDATVMLTLKRPRQTGDESSESGPSDVSPEQRTWHSTATSATAACLGLPGRRLHEAKQAQFDRTLQTMLERANSPGLARIPAII